MTNAVPPRRKGVVGGMLAFGFGVFALIAAGLQRCEGQLSYGGRSGPMRTLPRDENPGLFDAVTYGLLGLGALLCLGGLAAAWRSSPRVAPPSDGSPPQ